MSYSVVILILTSQTIAEFDAAVGLSVSTSDASERGRVAMTPSEIRVRTGDTARRVALADVFDIVRDVSGAATPETTETVTLAFKTGSRRETLAVRADAGTLVKFQGLLFKQLLANVDVTVTRRRADDETDHRRPCRLGVSAAEIRFEPADDGAPIVVRRDGVTRFSLSGADAPAVVLFLSAPDRAERVSVRFPSFHLLNLFGRYLRADLLAVDALGSVSDGDDAIEVLLVDDDEQSREMTRVFLTEESKRFSVTEASSASEALNRLSDPRRVARIECIVSDYEMPAMDGIEFLGAVRDRHPALPFILYTGRGSEEVAKQAILDDVTDYVEKEVGPQQYAVLAERIEKAVR
jgi:CheY-like chemotaxis protein